VGILGTRFTMAGPVYRDALAGRGIEALAPEPADGELVDRVIFAELVDGVFREESRQAGQRVIERLGRRGCDAVALACTEIPLLMRPAGRSPPGWSAGVEIVGTSGAASGCGARTFHAHSRRART